ncbi:hypothetical protein B0T18DRAFT_441031 [Schizothecium vesticola]|uniref:Uncharacterized protein n=1 Tax=Schizothecium vesticola TaxID=314040 RepID=A0AA40BPW6_9PEZI|nr:hypothetical protein B0T18DRAFT_441031 [Schizothecium vesticola]
MKASFGAMSVALLSRALSFWRPQRGRPRLPLLQRADWNPNLPYNESPPTCIHYSIEWKLLLKKGRLSKLTNDTEQNLVLAPGAFWDQTLEPKLQQLLAKKTPRNKCYEPDETNVVVSVTDRSQRDLTKRFDELDIDWGVVENQLVAWSHLLRDGRQLRIDISFIYKETTQQVAGNILRTHGDVPPWIRELIYAKEQQDSERRKKKRQASLSDGLPLIRITNLDIPAPIDKSLHRYCKWLCARVTDPVRKNGYQDACRIALEEGLDLERLYNAQDVEARSLAERGVKRGIAIQFVSKVKAWLDEV